MSKKWLSHYEWIHEQFKPKYLPGNFRNTMLHAIIIEGVLKKETGRKGITFSKANKYLLDNVEITNSEFCAFNDIRNIRNEIAHDIVKKGFSQKELDKIIKKLVSKILEVYRGSAFLDKNLFKKYGLKSMIDNNWALA